MEGKGVWFLCVSCVLGVWVCAGVGLVVETGLSQVPVYEGGEIRLEV